jgi:adenosine deaminase
VNDNYRAVSEALTLGRDEIAAIVGNGFRVALMTDADRQRALAEIERVLLEG